MFEKIVVLQTRFLEEEGAGADPENVSSLRKWVAKVILPSEAFAELSPYSIGSCEQGGWVPG